MTEHLNSLFPEFPPTPEGLQRLQEAIKFVRKEILVLRGNLALALAVSNSNLESDPTVYKKADLELREAEQKLSLLSRLLTQHQRTLQKSSSPCGKKYG